MNFNVLLFDSMKVTRLIFGTVVQFTWNVCLLNQISLVHFLSTNSLDIMWN